MSAVADSRRKMLDGIRAACAAGGIRGGGERPRERTRRCRAIMCGEAQ